ncbi:MAG: MmcB family DNA repair protein [Alphaproteobacteria bacterium]|nr:MmcB family DNA repair protein [Alphaproteobacteria bacterium]
MKELGNELGNEPGEVDHRAMPSGLARDLARGVLRMLEARGHACLVEFSLRNGRRADLIALDRHGQFTIVEIKTSAADFRADAKWREYVAYCNSFYFAVPEDFPHDLLPAECGLIKADAFGGAILREAAEGAMNAARRKALTLRFARAAGLRLMRATDPGPGR